MDPEYRAGEIVESYISNEGCIYSHETQANLVRAIADEIKRFILEEREACAKTVEGLRGGKVAAADIRARQ